MNGEQKEVDFINRWHKEEALYAAWGQYVAHTLCKKIEKDVAPTTLEMFLKIPVTSRVKTTESLVQKAFYRKKNYEDPFREIEDKVGLRFVVLLADDIRIIENAITSEESWTYDKARDFLEEQESSPYEFDYQSLHYVVRSKIEINSDGINIPSNTPCEIQVRTLLQHAYSELTHDTIYKPSVQTTPALKRAAAKSMALIEATGDYFTQVSDTIRLTVEKNNKVNDIVNIEFSKRVSENFENTPLNKMIIDHYKNFIDPEKKHFSEWLDEKNFIIENIILRSKKEPIYRVPSIILVYYSVSTSPHSAKINSPLTDNELGPIYSDLGLGLNG